MYILVNVLMSPYGVRYFVIETTYVNHCRDCAAGQQQHHNEQSIFPTTQILQTCYLKRCASYLDTTCSKWDENGDESRCPGSGRETGETDDLNRDLDGITNEW